MFFSIKSMAGGVSLKHILEQLAEERLSYLVNGHAMRQESEVGDLEVMERKKKLLENVKLTL